MQVRIYIGEPLTSEETPIVRYDEKDRVIESTTLKELYENGWTLHSIAPIPEDSPFRVYVTVERK